MRLVFLLLLCLVTPLTHAEGLLDKLPAFGNKQQPVFLPPDQAFALEVQALDSHTLQADFIITSGYYLYRDKTRFTINGDTTKITEIKIPEGELKQDPNFGETHVFHQSFQAIITLNRTTEVPEKITLNAAYQGCSDQGLCYPSQDKVLIVELPGGKQPVANKPESVKVAIPSTTTEKPTQTEGTEIANLFKNGSYWLIISFFFGAGLLLALTPCVFPMIPILSGIIVGRGHKITRMHAFLLSLAYVLGMAITYSAAGVAAGFSGNLISNALQTPWVLGSFAGIFVLLSLSMFGFYELQLPSSWQSKLSETSNRLHGGHLSGVFIMGALSAIIMGPCVAAPLAGALLYIGQTHDALLGGIALFALAMGMGAPLLAIGTSAGALLPKAGAWMDGVKRFFGVMLLALAIWIIQPLLPMSVQMLLWGALLILSASYLRVLESLPHNAHARHKLLKGVGLIALLIGTSYLIGALSGARDLLRPLDAVCAACKAETEKPLKFTRIKSNAELNQHIASANGKIVMLDFYADWCISCKEMERFTFSNATIQAKLQHAIVLQADVTANNEDDKALLKRFGLYGPPGILFFDAQGNELNELRVVGYQDAVQFQASLQRVGL